MVVEGRVYAVRAADQGFHTPQQANGSVCNVTIQQPYCRRETLSVKNRTDND
jgi:hypothetical protein